VTDTGQVLVKVVQLLELIKTVFICVHNKMILDSNLGLEPGFHNSGFFGFSLAPSRNVKRVIRTRSRHLFLHSFSI
jgi:hypothetical protein